MSPRKSLFTLPDKRFTDVRFPFGQLAVSFVLGLKWALGVATRNTRHNTSPLVVNSRQSCDSWQTNMLVASGIDSITWVLGYIHGHSSHH